MDALNILNAIHSNMDELYQSRIPIATKNNIELVGQAIVSNDREQNMMFSELFGVVFAQEIINRTYNSKFGRLKGDNIPNGLDAQSIYVNPAVSVEFDPEGKSLMKLALADVKSFIVKRMRKSEYAVSVSDEQVLDAFTSIEKLTTFFQAQLNSLINGDNIDEDIIFSSVLASSLASGIIPIIELEDYPNDKASGEKYVKTSQLLYMDFLSASENWNPYNKAYPTPKTGNPAITWVESEDNIVQIIKNDVFVNVGVDVLAPAYNMRVVDFKKNIISIPTIGTCDSCLSIIADESAFILRDNLLKNKKFENGSGLTTKFMRHHWQTAGINLFANCVAIMIKTTVTLDKSTVSLSAGSPTATVTATVTPTTVSVKYFSSDDSVATVDDNGLVTRIKAGTCAITCIAGGYKKATVDVTCS